MARLAIRFWWRWLLARLTWVLGSLVGRRPPHPALRRHERVRLDPAAVQRSADEGSPIGFRLARRQIELRVEPVSVFAEDAQIVTLDEEGEAQGEEPSVLPVPETLTYAGSVIGDESSEVRLTIAGDTLTGVIQTGGEVWFIDPMRRFRRDADRSEFVAYRPHDAAFRLAFGADAKPGTTEPDTGEDPPHRVNPEIGLAIWADLDYRDQAEVIGMPWWSALAALVNNMNGFYRRDLGIVFVIRRCVLHVGSVLSSTDAERLLDQFGVRVRAFHGDIREVSVREDTGVEVAHLATGKNLDGRTLGIAWQPGVWSLSQQQLFWIGGGGLFGGGPNLSYQNMMIGGHELGHNFDGEHDDADKICVAHFLWCWDYERTIMWPTFYSDNRDDFSPRNETRIKDNAQNGRNRRFTHP